MLLQRIEEHMKVTRITPSRFGREAVGDPMFVSNLRDGREPRSRTVARVIQYMERSSDMRG